LTNILTVSHNVIKY